MDRRTFLKAVGLGELGLSAASLGESYKNNEKYESPSPENIKVGDIRIEFYEYSNATAPLNLSFCNIRMGRVVSVGQKGYHVMYNGIQHNNVEYDNFEDYLVFLRPNKKNLEIVAASKPFQEKFPKFISTSSRLLGAPAE